MTEPTADPDPAEQTTEPGPSVSVDLSPRDLPGAAKRRSLRNWCIVGALSLVLAGILYQALTSARVFFYNVDEAIARRDELGSQTFRIQGTVVDEPADIGGAMVFTIAFNDETAVVRHVGDEPSDLFEVGIPVVAEGHWEGEAFESRQLLVKHSESYVEDNPDRLVPDK
ncbi:MAG: cytochrome c maturation protein CcmE [Actinomycetota bacterium]|nr:cytochrome c maturation protein CcmE [Actinomycetota bacterium]